jgi:hypothetical protein
MEMQRSCRNLRIMFGLAAIVFALPLASHALAHEGKHTGTAVHGRVVSLSGDLLKVKTEDAEVSVTLTDKTKILSDKEAVPRTDLVAGAHVDIRGSKLPGGGFAAREVSIERESDGSSGAGSNP